MIGMTNLSWICLAGYAVAQVVICEIMDAGAIERLIGMLGALPLGVYCDWKDREEKQE